MKRILLAATMGLFLAACVPATKPDTQFAHIPVTVHADTPAPVYVERPYLAIWNLTPTSSDDDTAKAYKITVEQLSGYADKLEAALKPFFDAAKKSKAQIKEDVK